MDYDGIMPCVCCGKQVLIRFEVWRKLEAPYAACYECYSTVPRSVMNVLYVLRSQVKTLKDEQDLMKKDIQKLYKAQQELEQDFIRMDEPLPCLYPG